jgi:rare lipoprotein A
VSPRPASPSIGPTPPGEPLAFVEEGIASWYGAPFNGRTASSGEIYDMNQPVAAHRTLPFGSIVRVTNMKNGQHTDVRIIDRGPFVSGRIIDLSLAAARELDMVRAGTAQVRIELLSSPSPLAGNFTVQIGAFEQRQNAERLRTQLQNKYVVFIQEFDGPAGHFFRVRVGREPTPQAAQRLAGQLAQGGFHPFVVRLDEIR